MQHEIMVSTRGHEELIDITPEIEKMVAASKIREGLCTVFVRHATAAIIIIENDDPNLGTDFLTAMKTLIPDHRSYLHDEIDNNAAAHIKAAMLGPGETIPITQGRLALGRWQSLALCELDGPRERRIIVAISSTA